jgi:hypothetical protein
MIINTINTTSIEFVPKSDFDKLLHENTRLKQRESELIGQLTDLQLTVNTQRITIEELTQQNELLREKIKILEKDVLYLKNENQTLNTYMIELKNDNKTLKLNISELKRDKIFSKLMVVIQDLNYFDSLETKEPRFSKKLNRFRNNRNGEFHFIMNEDNDFEKREKRFIIKQFLNKLDKETINEFETNNRVEGLIYFIKNHLKNTQNVILNDDDEEDLDIKNNMIQFFGNCLTLDDLAL